MIWQSPELYTKSVGYRVNSVIHADYSELTDLTANKKRSDMNQSVAFLEFVIKGLVDEPEKVEIVRTVDEMGVLLSLKVAPVDMGKIIGRKGATAKSIRTLLRVVGMKSNERVNLKIVEPEGYVRPDRPEASDIDAAMDDLKGEF